MAKMNIKRQEQLQALLSEEKQRLWNELRVELFKTLGEGLHTQYEIPQDISEQGTIDLLADTGLAVADIHREELTRIEEALQKLENGSYGICEDCGEWIDQARLRVKPYAACCLNCQHLREGPARAAGVTM